MYLYKNGSAAVAVTAICLIFWTTVSGQLPQEDSKSATHIYSEFEDEATILEPLNSAGEQMVYEDIPNELAEMDKVTHVYTSKDEAASTGNKVVNTNLLEYADEAMSYVEGVYSRIQSYNTMYAGKSDELLDTMSKYTYLLSKMLNDKTGISHLSFVRRYLNHATKIKDDVRDASEARNNVMKEANAIYYGIKESYNTIKLDFERYYTKPGVVINTAVSSLMGIGESYKLLVKLHKRMFDATTAFRFVLNRLRATTVYMFSYLVCLDILYTEIMPLRMVAVQDVLGTKGTGDIMNSYHTNMINKRKAVKMLMRSPTLQEDVYHQIDRIYKEMSTLVERAKMMAKSTSSIVERIDKHGIKLLNRKIALVVDAWNDNYKRPIVMATKLNKEFKKLSKMANKIKDELNAVHTTKQSLYTMSTRCNELYAIARKLAGLEVVERCPTNTITIPTPTMTNIDQIYNGGPNVTSFGHDQRRSATSQQAEPLPPQCPTWNNSSPTTDGNGSTDVYRPFTHPDYRSYEPMDGDEDEDSPPPYQFHSSDYNPSGSESMMDSAKGCKRKYDEYNTEDSSTPKIVPPKPPRRISQMTTDANGTKNYVDGVEGESVPSPHADELARPTKSLDSSSNETAPSTPNESHGDNMTSDIKTMYIPADNRCTNENFDPLRESSNDEAHSNILDGTTLTYNGMGNDTYRNMLAVDLMDLLKRVLDVNRRVKYYQPAIKALKSKSDGVPGARTSKFIIAKVKEMNRMLE
ncbi:putative integral membrane protein [Babesia bovis T2Bo]|uniref:Uncharacterized protein n=1 Tax=Babesia bovis TaxID=5865 RepID=A7AWD8_BABBO|nr:putative integral membrane protein [Babesia bovis T2Bo]EDO05366.1 putative integral membrane protein [Babesia bovis T2Bo]|eukprot:XP_001608934.1 hypothetical protein [Babesia bovis T2Bo]